GWIQSDNDSSATVAAPLAAPVSSNGSDEGSGHVVHQIYEAGGEGVAFIESKIAPTEAESTSPFGEFFGEPESQPEGGGTATGSGFVIDGEGHILTNNHVIEGAETIHVKLGSSDTNYTAEVVGADPGTDIALLKVDAPSDQLHPLKLGDSSTAEVGDP